MSFSPIPAGFHTIIPILTTLDYSLTPPTHRIQNGGGMMGTMKGVIYAALVAWVFTFVPIFVLRLDSETKFVDSLKWFAASLGIPGAFVCLLAAFGRVHDIDLWVTYAADSAFYFVIVWPILKAFDRSHGNEVSQSGQ
jgi:hypothetical protein